MRALSTVFLLPLVAACLLAGSSLAEAAEPAGDAVREASPAAATPVVTVVRRAHLARPAPTPEVTVTRRAQLARPAPTPAVVIVRRAHLAAPPSDAPAVIATAR